MSTGNASTDDTFTADLGAAATALLVKTTLLTAHWAGFARKRALSALTTAAPGDKDTEIAFLRDRVQQLEIQVGILRKHVGKREQSRYTLAERLHVLWFMEYFQVPRRKVTGTFGIARSTLYRWLHRIDAASPTLSFPHNRTPVEVAALVWEIAQANLQWGRVRIANQLALVGVFIAASTVRNILARPKPKEPVASAITPATNAATTIAKSEPAQRRVAAFYPNHVWSIDCTDVRRWSLWPTQVLVVIDHFSRKVVAATPLAGPNAGWVCEALERAFTTFGPPKHIISDQHPVFTSAAVTELLDAWSVERRFGAIGKHGSIAVTERVIWTLKYEWLFRVPLIKGFDHLESLCADFTHWYNAWRPHMRLDGARPDDVYGRDLPEPVNRGAKVVPIKIERRHFAAARVTGFRISKAA